MANETKPTILTNIYEREFRYMQTMERHSREFDLLIASVPEDKPQVANTMRELYHVEPDKLLDPEKIGRLKRENEPMFREVSLYYSSYLRKLLQLE